VDHAEMGGEMARMWDFPDRLRLAITYHHLDRPEAYTDDLTLLVYLADILVMMFGQDLGMDGLAYTGYPEVLRHFHLREKNLQRILMQFGSAWDEAQIFFGLMGNQDGVQRANRG
jgi:HD-like signal output (HDOD) protein